MNTENAEIWKPIEGFEELYHVSNYGRVKSTIPHNGTNERILKPHSVGRGYLQIGLHKEGKTYDKLIHRLVAEAFIDNPNNLPCVNHKDENKGNNHVQNLEWVSYKENDNYGTRNKRNAEARINHPNMSKIVLQYSLDGTFIKEYHSVQEVERQLGFNQGNIASCCRGNTRLKTYKGFKWLYKEDVS